MNKELMYPSLVTILSLLVYMAFVGLVAPLFTVLGQEISGRDLILILGGLFLVYKGTVEIHHKTEDEPGEHGPSKSAAGFAGTPAQRDVVSTDVKGPRPALWAVSVGVSRYPRLSPAQQLDFATADARSITAALAVTFPFNLLLGIPLYFAVAQHVAGA